MEKKKIAIVEIGGSHDECILSQLIALKTAGAEVILYATQELIDRNPLFQQWISTFHVVKFPGSAIGDFLVMRNLNKHFLEQKVYGVICNTAQGGHIRNLALTASKKIKFFGLIHTIKMLDGRFTQRLISTKIKDYFLLNDTLIQLANKPSGIRLHTFYPLNYPHFDFQIEKPNNEFWVSIIGGVENRRKDLDGLLEMVKQTSEHVHFQLLGKSNLQSEEVQVFLEKMNQMGIAHRLHYFDHFLSQEVLDGYLRQTDAILPLVHPNTPSAAEYFSRQISGAINVSFAYKIPMMIHEAYQSWEDFESGVVFYNKENFQEKWLVFQQDIFKLKSELEKNEKFNSELQNQSFAALVLSSLKD